MKKLIMVFVAAIVLIVGVCVAVSLIVAGQPKNIVGSALSGLSDDLMERQELSAIMKAMDGGSFEMAFENNGALPDIPNDLSLGGKIYFSEDALMAENIYVTYDGAKLLAGAYLDEDGFYVTNEDILGGTWGITRGQTQKQFENSVFYYESDSEYALPEEASVAISHILAMYDDGVDLDLCEDIEEVAERYTKEIWELICEYGDFDKETDEVRIGGERVDCRVVTLTLNDRAQKRVVRKLLQYWENDKALLKLVESYGKLVEDMAEDMDEAADLDVVQSYRDLIDLVMEKYDEALEDSDVELADIKVTVCTPKMSSTLLKLKITYDRNEILSVDFGPEGLAESEKISVKMYDTTVVYEITENSDELYKAALRVEYDASGSTYEGSNKQTVATIKVDRERETFSVTVAEQVKLSGTFESTKKGLTISMNKIEANETTMNPSLILTIKHKDRMPKREKTINSAFDINEETLQTWQENIREHALLKDYFNRETLSGTYSRSLTYTSTFTASYEFTSSGEVTYTVSLGAQISGTYRIEGDQIIFTYEDSPNLSGSHDFEKGEDYVKIDQIRYDKQ